MFTIRVLHHFDAPIEEVFACISDHEGYARLPKCEAANLLRKGEKDKNGVGAVREIVTNHIRFVEEIPVFEPPTLMEYRVIACHLSLFKNSVLIRFPLQHEIGRMTLAPQDNGTQVEWISRGELLVPVANKQVTRILVKKTQGLFLEALQEMAGWLEK